MTFSIMYAKDIMYRTRKMRMLIGDKILSKNCCRFFFPCERRLGARGGGQAGQSSARRAERRRADSTRATYLLKQLSKSTSIGVLS